jgi:hypothetical protein
MMTMDTTRHAYILSEMARSAMACLEAASIGETGAVSRLQRDIAALGCLALSEGSGLARVMVEGLCPVGPVSRPVGTCHCGDGWLVRDGVCLDCHALMCQALVERIALAGELGAERDEIARIYEAGMRHLGASEEETARIGRWIGGA